MRGVKLVLAGMCALFVTACQEEVDPSIRAEPAEAESTAAGAQEPPLEPVSVEVRMGDGMITLPQTTAPAGTITFDVVNDGTMPHTFAVRSGGQEYRTEAIRPGEAMLLTVELTAGSYEVYCAELEGGPHADQGERATFVVQ